MASIHERISQLEAELASLKAQVTADSARETPEAARTQSAGPTSRRQLLKLAGAAAVGAAGMSLTSATPAGATTGAMMFGASNNAGTDFTELESSNSDFATLLVNNTTISSDSGVGKAIWGGSSTGPAVVGTSTAGYGLVGQGTRAPLRLIPAGAPGPPQFGQGTGTHEIGEVRADANGALFQCVGPGDPGTWLRIGFNPMPVHRILDTRPATRIGPVTGPIGPGQTVSLAVAGANVGVPSQASALVLNVTVTEGTAASFLTIWPHDAPRPLASNLNWTPGQTVPNLAIVGVSPVVFGTGGAISIFNNVGDVQVILDLAGFYS